MVEKLRCTVNLKTNADILSSSTNSSEAVRVCVRVCVCVYVFVFACMCASERTGLGPNTSKGCPGLFIHLMEGYTDRRVHVLIGPAAVMSWWVSQQDYGLRQHRREPQNMSLEGW